MRTDIFNSVKTLNNMPYRQFLGVFSLACALSTPAVSVAQVLDPMVSNSLIQARALAQPQAPATVLLPGPEAAVPAPSTPPPAELKFQPSQFQQFVKMATGQDLAPYGHLFFSNPGSYAPVANIASPDNYLIGPGDEIQLQAWGGFDLSTRLSVDRNGNVQIPKVGVLNLSGVRADQLSGVFRSHLGKVFTNVDVSASLSKMRTLQVYVVGQAVKPGTHTLSGLSTLVNALFASGGPSSNGSMRNIELRRGNQVVTRLDLYAFLAQGDKSGDVPLQPGDIIVIPPVGPRVAVAGAFDHPAIYELKGSTSVQQLLSMGGGVPPLATTDKALLERIVPTATPPRQVQQLALTGTGLQTTLQDGDILTLVSISQSFANAVTLKGNVAYPLRHVWHTGMRVLDLIPDAQALVTQDYYKNKNNLVQSILSSGNKPGQFISNNDTIHWEYALIERQNKQTLQTQLIPFNLGKAVLGKDPAHNLQLQAGDVVTVFSQKDLRLPAEKQLRLVRVEGEVAAPGIYPALPGETMPQLLRRIGGFTPQAYVFGTEFSRESVRQQQQQNLDQLVSRLEANLNSSSNLQAANLGADQAARAAAMLEAQKQTQRGQLDRLRNQRSNGRVALELPPGHAELASLPPIPLENGDTIVVPSMPSFVAAYGAVNNQNAVVYRPGRTVADLVRVAGLTEDADEEQAFVLRADGTVVARKTSHSGWLGGGFDSLPLMPGDTLVVPLKVDRETFWTVFMRNAKDITQILSNFGLGVAALRSL